MQIEFLPGDWSINSVRDRQERINPKPQYQRTPVWNEAKKQLLIDSILRGYDLPKFYLRLSDPPYEHEVVDGQQRLRAIWDFCDDKYVLGDESNDIPDLGDLSDQKWSELSSQERDQIGEFKLSVAVIKGASDREIRQLFRRLQEGVSLNPAEKRNAIEGEMRDFIATLGDTHRVFPLTCLRDTRFKWHDLAAIVTCLEMAGGPTDVKAPNLSDMYENNQSFNSNGPIAGKVKRHLNYMMRVLKDRPPEMKIKWGFVDLYLLISKMSESYVIQGRENDFTDFYVAFEIGRLAIDDPRDLLSSDKNFWDKDLYDYIQAFKSQGGTRENIEKRHEVYKKRFIRDVQDLMPKAPRRAFTHDERIVIWRQTNESCQMCPEKITLDEMEADHIIPYGEGGPTIIANGQALCQPCHISKHRLSIR